MTYVVALIREEKDGILGISFPDFPGCVSAAYNMDDVITRGAKTLAAHVKHKVENNETFPVIRRVDDIRRTENLDGAIIAAVPVDLPGKSVPVQITMDERLLSELDRVASTSGTTRSGKISEAVRASLRP
ncbi:type II toxin-antitoxin system HicB family antitoxin [Pleomorphomonas sp. PLEO]|uniref:type II toxin-antitoxin system HicB family antitoxin n=1 Tax=Pleomorphomonas sp. PLEO TaxID=3239306 RepID=UPI00351ECC2E